MKKMISITLTTVLMLTLLASCGTGGLDGTYIPKDEVAKRMPYGKFVFSGSKVKMYMGTMGITVPVAYEYRYSVKGNIISIEAGIPGVNAGGIELTYDKSKHELSLFNDGTFGTGIGGAVWGKEGTFDPSKTQNSNENSSNKDVKTQKPLTEKGEATEKVSNSNDVKKGQLVFLTHGLSDKVTCFEETVKLLKSNKNYCNLGYVTMRDNGKTATIHFDGEFKDVVNYLQWINKQTNEGVNVLVRTEFSTGNLSFSNQLEEMRKMVGMFDGHTADVVFVGHSMGGLASINYAIDYTGTYKKKVKIITVNTPYHPNTYAAVAWNNEHMPNNNASELGTAFNAVFYKKPVGEAQRDLGGISSALNDLRTKWDDFTHSGNGSRVKRYVIAVSMYAKWNENDKENTEKNWSDKGDGVVDIPSQEGVGWSNVFKTAIFGYGKGHVTPLGDLQDTTHSYHHTQTLKREKVIQQIKNFIEWE